MNFKAIEDAAILAAWLGINYFWTNEYLGHVLFDTCRNCGAVQWLWEAE